MGFEDYFRLYLSTLIWALLLALIFYLPERLAPAEKAQPRAKRIVNLIYTPVPHCHHIFDNYAFDKPNE